MTIPSIIEQAPALKGKKLLTFTHENREGFSYYHAMVPSHFTPPQGTIGGEQDVEETPELWAEYKRFIDLLDINFDPEDSNDFLWCSEDAAVDIAMIDESLLA